MEIKELRVGNLLDRNGIMEVLGIGANNKLIIYDHYNKERLPYGLDVDSFKGIELTPEWLERFGFKGNLDDGFGLDVIELGYIVSDEYFQLEYKTPYGPWMLVYLKYVHQLQNLFYALTGKELTINKT